MAKNKAVEKHTYTFISPMDLDFCWSKLSDVLRRPWKLTFKRQYGGLFVKNTKNIKPALFSVTETDDQINFSVWLSLSRLYYPFLDLVVVGYIKQTSTRQTLIFLTIENKPRRSFYRYLEIWGVFLALTGNLVGRLGSLYIVGVYRQERNSAERYIQHYIKDVLSPLARRLNATEVGETLPL